MNKDSINSQIAQINTQYNIEKERYVQGKAPQPPSDRIDELRRLYRSLFTASNFTQKELENMLNEEHKVRFARNRVEEWGKGSSNPPCWYTPKRPSSRLSSSWQTRYHRGWPQRQSSICRDRRQSFNSWWTQQGGTYRDSRLALGHDKTHQSTNVHTHPGNNKILNIALHAHARHL